MWRCRYVASGWSLFFIFIINSRVGIVSAGDEWPSPYCHYPDWLRRRTWKSLNGQLQFSVDRSGTALYRKRSMTSSMTSETGSVSGSEYRCRQRSEDGYSYEPHRSSTVQVSAFVLHYWFVVLYCAMLACAKNWLWATLCLGRRGDAVSRILEVVNLCTDRTWKLSNNLKTKMSMKKYKKRFENSTKVVWLGSVINVDA